MNIVVVGLSSSFTNIIAQKFFNPTSSTMASLNIMAVLESNDERYENFKRSYPFHRARLRTINELVQAKQRLNLQAAYITSPIPDRIGDVINCLQAGLSVIVELPLTTNIFQIEKLELAVQLAEQKNLLLLAPMPWFFEPVFEYANKMDKQKVLQISPILSMVYSKFFNSQHIWQAEQIILEHIEAFSLAEQLLQVDMAIKPVKLKWNRAETVDNMFELPNKLGFTVMLSRDSEHLGKALFSWCIETGLRGVERNSKMIQPMVDIIISDLGTVPHVFEFRDTLYESLDKAFRDISTGKSPGDNLQAVKSILPMHLDLVRSI